MSDLVLTVRAETPEWFALSFEANTSLQKILMRAVETHHGHSGEPATIATFLMLRLTSAFQGAILMIERGMVVEARMLTRSIVEDALCLGALCTSSESFIPMLESDSGAAKKAQAKLIIDFELAKASEHHAAIELIAQNADKLKQLNWKQVAELILAGVGELGDKRGRHAEIR